MRGLRARALAPPRRPTHRQRDKEPRLGELPEPHAKGGRGADTQRVASSDRSQQERHVAQAEQLGQVPLPRRVVREPRRELVAPRSSRGDRCEGLLVPRVGSAARLVAVVPQLEVGRGKGRRALVLAPRDADERLDDVERRVVGGDSGAAAGPREGHGRVAARGAADARLVGDRRGAGPQQARVSDLVRREQGREGHEAAHRQQRKPQRARGGRGPRLARPPRERAAHDLGQGRDELSRGCGQRRQRGRSPWGRHTFEGRGVSPHAGVGHARGHCGEDGAEGGEGLGRHGLAATEGLMAKDCHLQKEARDEEAQVPKQGALLDDAARAHAPRVDRGAPLGAPRGGVEPAVAGHW